MQLLRRTRSHRRTRKKSMSALGRRRRRIFRIKVALTIFVLLVIVALAGWLLRHPEVTISSIVITGNNLTPTEDIEVLIQDELDSSYALVIPKRSAFFYPKNKLITTIDEAFARIEGVVVRQKNFTTLRIDVAERSPFALWCGKEFVEDGERFGDCYFIDDQSYVYASAPDFTGNVFFKYFGALALADNDREDAPIGSTYMSEQDFFGIRPFIGAFEDLGYAPLSLTRMDDGDFELRMDDGAKIIFSSDTKLSILLDNMESILDSDSFREAKDQPLEYIDLRFGNKVYYKFQEEEQKPEVIENVVE